MTAERTDVEFAMARHTVRRAVVVGPVLVLVFWLLRGFDGAWASLIGVLVVVGNFLLAGLILSLGFRVSLSMYHAAALLGFFLRLVVTIVAVVLIAKLVDLDRLAFGISAVVAYLTLITWEAVAVSQGKERNLDWTA